MQDPWLSLSFENILTVAEKITEQKLSNVVIQRNSYINRVYELSSKTNEQEFIIKFYRPGRWSKQIIKEEHLFLFKLFNADLPVIAPLCFHSETLFSLGEINFALFEKKGGRAIDELSKESWIQVGRMLGRMHLIGKTINNSKRIVWSPEKATKKSVSYLLENNFIPKEFVASFERVVDFFMQQSSLFYKEPLHLIHGDCHLGNLINRLDEGMFIVDFDDICIGPAVQDLWMLLPGKPEECEKEINWFIEGYEVFGDFKMSSLQLVPMLKVMRMIHFAGWCALQYNDIGFKEHFPDWGTTQYWNQLIREIQENVYRRNEG